MIGPRGSVPADSPPPLGLRMRPDLQVYSQAAEGRPVWVIKDPLTRAYHRLEAEEFAILQMLDGRTGQAALRAAFARRFAPQRLSALELEQFLARLHRDGLAVSDAPGQSERLAARRRRRLWGRRLQAWTNPLAIRFPGVDPDRFLHAAAPYCGWLFSRRAVTVGLAFVLAMGGFAAARFEEIAARLPTAAEALRADNLALLMAALMVVKVLHELGHALACKRLGGECREIGLLLLIFTPCLYCDVSDSWTFPHRWRRAAVAAAGVYVELLLAAACAAVWLATRPGVANSLALNVMLVCSVGTVVFNANPLLRYDGYFVLADLWGVANLRQRSRAVLGGALAHWCLGWPRLHARWLPRHRRALAVYAATSIAYTWLVIASVLWFLHRGLQAHGWGAATGLLAIVAVGKMCLEPAVQAVRILHDPMQRRRLRPRRVAATAAAAGLLGAAFLAAPLPHRISAPAVLWPAEAHAVYVTVPGLLAEAVAEGETVAAGDVLATLTNRDVEQELTQLASRARELRLRLAHLEADRHHPSPALAGEAAAALPVTAELLADVEARLGQRQRDRERLRLRAPVAGTVIPPPRQAAPGDLDGELPPWTGSPLQACNRRCFLETGTLVCLIGAPTALEAVVAIEQPDVGLLQPGQRVRLKLDCAPQAVLNGEITQIARHDEPGEPGLRDDNLWRPALPRRAMSATVYRARVALRDLPREAVVGGRGQAQIITARQSLGDRLRRYLARTFRLA